MNISNSFINRASTYFQETISRISESNLKKALLITSVALSIFSVIYYIFHTRQTPPLSSSRILGPNPTQNRNETPSHQIDKTPSKEEDKKSAIPSKSAFKSRDPEATHEDNRVVKFESSDNLRPPKTPVRAQFAKLNFSVDKAEIPVDVEELIIKQCTVTDDFLNTLNPELKKLSLPYCKIKDNQLSLLPSNLRYLDIRSCISITALGIENLLKKCPEIQVLILDGCLGIEPEKFRELFSENTLPPLGNKIIEISLARMIEFKDETIENLPRGLKKLNAEDCSRLTGAGLAKLTNLREVNLNGCIGVTDVVVPFLEKLCKEKILTKVSLQDCDLLSKDARARLANMTTINLKIGMSAKKQKNQD